MDDRNIGINRDNDKAGALPRPCYVLDTNVLLAAVLPPVAGPRRPRHRHHGVLMAAVVAAARAQGVLLLSPETLDELAEVINRPGFDRYVPAEARRDFLDALWRESRMVMPVPAVRLCSDATDDKFLALALAGDADALVTQDKAVLALGRVGRTPILHPNRFATLLGVGEVRRGQPPA